jgi:hypothetical protein
MILCFAHLSVCRKEDWNEIQRRNTVKADPIGARSTSIKRKDSRKSLRKQILEHNAAGENVPADQLLGILCFFYYNN